MYKLSFEKCVCFIFLIILALLSCSGFRIDRLTTMSDINKRNSFTSTSLSSKSNDFNSSRPFSTVARHSRNISEFEFLSTQNNFAQTRHLKSRKNQNRRNRITQQAQALRVEPHEQPKPNHHPTGRINTIVIPPKNELTSAPVSRLQRSPNNKVKPLHPRNNKAFHCQRQDVARKAYLSNTVVRAKAESMSSNRIHNYSVTFRILERYKTFLPVDDTLRLTFSSDTKDMNCEIEGHKRPPHDLVKAQIQQSKEYFLFLNSHGMHNYSVVGMPVLKKKRHNNNNNNIKRNKDLEDIKRVTNKNFVLKPPKKPKIRSNRIEDLRPGKKLRLVCNLKGFPVPYVSWRKNGKDGLHSSKRMRITYKNSEDENDKKKTTLLINSVQIEDEGVYQCISKGVDGSITQDEIQVRIANSEQEDGDECKDDRFKKNFCLNGGTCVRIMHKEIGCHHSSFRNEKWSINLCTRYGTEEVYLQCRDGFTGERCEKKDVSNHSSMYGQNTFSCKLGLSTTYYC